MGKALTAIRFHENITSRDDRGTAFIFGMKRALFSSEAGLGSAPIAHSAVKTPEPVTEGVVAGLEPFIDTLVVCTMTALVILISGVWNRESTIGWPERPEKEAPLMTWSDLFPTTLSYARASYPKMATNLVALRSILGDSLFLGKPVTEADYAGKLKLVDEPFRPIDALESLALTYAVAQNIAHKPYDRELGEMARTIGACHAPAAP